MAKKNKIKTHKATKKRFKVSATGKLRHNKQGDNDHFKIKKSRNRKARLSGKTELGSKKQAKKLKSLLNN